MSHHHSSTFHKVKVMSECRIGVFGAGVVGLNTALELQRHLRNAQITVVADKFNEETLSDGAAGLFLPASYFSGPTAAITLDWLNYSLDFYKSLMKDEQIPIKELSGYILSRISYARTRNHLMEKLVHYKRVEDDELGEISPGDWKYGSYFTTLIIDSRLFLPWALKRFLTNGGTVSNGRLTSFTDVSKYGKFDAIINCTGLGAKELCKDTKLVPIRGQVFKVNAPWLSNFYYGDENTYIIPGISAVTLGGTYNFGSWDTEVNKYDSKSIIEHCSSIIPRLIDAPIIREWVGLRPYRPVVRVQPEIINGLKVVHNYGHGGYGVTSSPGTGKTAVEMAVDLLRSTVSKY